jgi:hypothetical protein
MCNGGTLKIPVRPGAPRRSLQCCPLHPAKFTEEKSTGLFSEKIGGKSGISRGKSGFVIIYDNQWTIDLSDR